MSVAAGDGQPPPIPAGARLLTYAEAGELLGVDPESIKRRAQRLKWPRIAGNDGRTRVAVPAEVLAEAETRQAKPAEAPPLPGLTEVAAELVRQAEDARQARAVADARLAQLGELRAELERLRSAAGEAVRFGRQRLPPGYSVERNRLDGTHRWRRLSDGAAGAPLLERWSAWRAAWHEHRQESRRPPAVPEGA